MPVASPQQPVAGVTARNIALILMFIAGCAPFTLNAPKQETLNTPTVSARELPNFHVVHNYLYRGAAPSFAGMDQLKTLGVKTVIDLRRTPIMLEAEKAHLDKLNIRYVSIPMGDWIPSKEKQELFLRTVSAAASDPSQAPVFLHCSHGSDRTGFLTAMWRVQHDGWSLGQAAVEMLQHGFLIHKLDPNPESRIDQ